MIFPGSDQGDSTDPIVGRVRALGFESVNGYVVAFPAEDYLMLAKRLGRDVVPIHLIRLHIAEARRRGSLRAVAREVLARSVLRNLPFGWGTGEKCDFNTASAYSDWSCYLELHGESPHLAATLRGVWLALKAIPPPVGWKPTTGHDPLIGLAFDTGWPEQSVSSRSAPQ